MGIKNSKLPRTLTLRIGETPPKCANRYAIVSGNYQFNFWKLKSKLTKADKRAMGVEI